VVKLDRTTKEAILRAIRDSLKRVATEDAELLRRGVHEVSLVHRFGGFLESALDPVIQGTLSVDIEYNRRGDDVKQLPGLRGSTSGSSFRPDLIVHRRGFDDRNLLVVEWKKSADDQTIEQLTNRVRSLVRSTGYGYEIGVIVDSSSETIRWMHMGRAGPLSSWKVI
jgi:hypothetical protein